MPIMPRKKVTLLVQKGNDLTLYEDIFKHSDSVTIGRGPDAGVPLLDPTMTVSRRHCVLEIVEGEVTIQNLSINDTFWNSRSLHNRSEVLSDGDELLLRPFLVLVEICSISPLFCAQEVI